jgi:hypothetical protein
MSDSEDYDIDPSKIKNEIYTGEEEDNDKEEEKKYEPKDEKIYDFDKANVIDECYIDNLKEEEDKDIGFDLSLLKRNELYVNLIHFDTNIINSENYRYFNNFKVDVVGGFQAIDKLDLLERYLEAIKIKKIPFIVISSGSSGKDVIQICKKFSFVKEVIIFCRNYKYNEHYLNEYPGYVKKVLTSIKDVYKYIKTFGSNKSELSKQKSDHFVFSYDQIKMNKQLEQCPVISAYEYDKCYFLIHRAYAHFFGDMKDKKSLPVFENSRFQKIKDFIEKSKLIEKEYQDDLIKKIEALKDVNNFTEQAIRTYTGESTFCYIFNRTMRNFEEGLISLAYYMGPFLYGLNKYVYENPDKFAFRENMNLYRNIQCSILDFYLYKINIKHIICFPSITSTSTVRGKFNPTGKAKKINKNDGISPEEIQKVTMIFNYKHEAGNISPGIIVKDNKGNDDDYLSKHKSENEVILFPFTFVRITEIKEIQKNQYEMYLDIINRKSYIEYTLRDDVKNRFLFSNLD